MKHRHHAVVLLAILATNATAADPVPGIGPVGDVRQLHQQLRFTEGPASDGKGKAVAAPNDVWQARTIERAWQAAGVPIETVELIEAHGTSTQVGDLTNGSKVGWASSQLPVPLSGESEIEVYLAGDEVTHPSMIVVV